MFRNCAVKCDCISGVGVYKVLHYELISEWCIPVSCTVAVTCQGSAGASTVKRYVDIVVCPSSPRKLLDRRVASAVK